jgi:chromosome segregation ATPase
LRRDVKNLEREYDNIKEYRDNIETECRAEHELLEAIQMMVTNYKKQIHEIRREKEKLQINVKNSHKMIENLQKRKDVLEDDSTKLFMDFKEAM